MTHSRHVASADPARKRTDYYPASIAIMCAAIASA